MRPDVVDEATYDWSVRRVLYSTNLTRRPSAPMMSSNKTYDMHVVVAALQVLALTTYKRRSVLKYCGKSTSFSCVILVLHTNSHIVTRKDGRLENPHRRSSFLRCSHGLIKHTTQRLKQFQSAWCKFRPISPRCPRSQGQFHARCISTIDGRRNSPPTCRLGQIIRPKQRAPILRRHEKGPSSKHLDTSLRR